MATKSKSLSFRVPKKLRKVIKWGAEQKEESQSDFMTTAVLELIDQLDKFATPDTTAVHELIEQLDATSDFDTTALKELVAQVDDTPTIDDLVLPEEFEIPTKDSKMVTIRVDPEVVEVVQDRAPRFYHTATRLILWASGRRAFRISAENNTEK